MKILSIYIETDKLKKGIDCYADVDLDMEREDGKSIIIRVPLFAYELSGSAYANSLDCSKLGR